MSMRIRINSFNEKYLLFLLVNYIHLDEILLMVVCSMRINCRCNRLERGRVHKLGHTLIDVLVFNVE